MKPYYSSDSITIYNADVLDALRELPSGSVHCVVTSPPYYGLRDYQCEGQIGLEASPAAWIAKMVELFGEVRRVMRKDATLWVNVGDSYAASTQGGGKGKRAGGVHHRLNEQRESQGHLKTIASLPPKSLLMMPARLAIAMQEDGWILRSDIIWAKPNPMPESVTDRPTKSHEHLFMFAKQGRYYYDKESIREPTSPNYVEGKGVMCAPHGEHVIQQGHTGKQVRQVYDRICGRNKPDVWTIPTEPTPEAHFATYPRALVRPCVRAGTSEKGVCGECGMPWARVVEHKTASCGQKPGYLRDCFVRNDGERACSFTDMESTTLGWKPSCTCNAEVIPATVLDPFFGSGTTGLVCLEEGRKCIGIDLSETYCELAVKKLYAKAPLFAAAGTEAPNDH